MMKAIVCVSLILALCAVSHASPHRAVKTLAKLHERAGPETTISEAPPSPPSHHEPALDAPERFWTRDVQLVNGKLVWTHSVAAAVYTSSQIAVDSAGAAFATSGTWLNQPFMADSTPLANDGTEQWTYAPSAPVSVVYRTASARHLDMPSAGPVDTIAAVTGADAPFQTCQLYGFSASGSNSPIWKYNITTYCYTDLVDQQMVVISDDGSTVAFLVASNHTVGGPLTVQLHVLNAQNGTLLFQYTLPASEQIIMRSVAMSMNGQYILFVNDRSIYVLDRDTGKLRNGHPISQSISPVATTLCPRGVFILTGYFNMTLFQWNSTAGDYSEMFSLDGVRSNGHQYVVYAVSTSVNGGGGQPMGCIGTVGWTRADDNAHAIAVDIFHMFQPYTVFTSWESTENTQVQNIPSGISMHMNYALVTAWGDYRANATSTQPTVLLFDANVPSSPIFTYVTPGSIYDGQVVLTNRDESGDTLVLSAAGKSTHANVMGNGGRAFSFVVSVSN